MSLSGFRLACAGVVTSLVLMSFVCAAQAGDQTDETRISGSLLKVTASHEGQRTAQGTAVAIARQGWLITSARIVQSGTQITVSNHAIGAHTAHIQAIDAQSDLALLRVDAVLDPATLARVEPAGGETVYAASAGVGTGTDFVSGTVTMIGQSLNHSALFGANGYGGALTNQCGELVGIDRTVSDIHGAPREGAQAATLQQIRALVRSQNFNLKLADTICDPDLMAATSRAKKAEARAKAAEQRANALHNSEVASLKQKQAADAAAKAAREEADTAEARQKHAEALSEKRKQVALAAQEESKRTRHMSYWGAGIGMALLILAGAAAYFFVARHRKRRHAAEEAADTAQRVVQEATVPPDGSRDLLLEGHTPAGDHIAIKIPALALKESRGGAVIGRSPEASEFVINRKGISRKHVKLFMRDHVLMAEDLNTTNGTSINGNRLSEPAELKEGDTLMLDDISLRLIFRGAQANEA